MLKKVLKALNLGSVRLPPCPTWAIVQAPAFYIFSSLCSFKPAKRLINVLFLVKPICVAVTLGRLLSDYSHNILAGSISSLRPISSIFGLPTFTSSTLFSTSCKDSQDTQPIWIFTVAPRARFHPRSSLQKWGRDAGA